MTTRTLAVLVVVVALLAVGALVLRGDSGESVGHWFRALHGGR